MAWFKANSKIIGNCRIFEKFLDHRISHQKCCLRTKFLSIKPSRRKIGKRKIEFYMR